MTLSSLTLYFHLFLLLLLLGGHNTDAAHTATTGGSWRRAVDNSGVSAMHMVVMPNDKAILFDRTNAGPSNISLGPEAARCCPSFNGARDCTAHAIEYDIKTAALRPLTLLSDSWCSSGGLAADGTLLQTGGYGLGDRSVRTLKKCASCDWSEVPNSLAVRRWYATNHILPDGSFIVVGGRRQYSYEFVPKRRREPPNAAYALPLLKITTDPTENNLYPFLHLAPDGNLFIFANRKSILLDYLQNKVIRIFPDIPGESRNYPSTGSSALLPLGAASGSAEVMICGGSPSDSQTEAEKSQFINASETCGRLRFTDPGALQWDMETLPMPRVISDMLVLPTGDILMLNGASRGTAGWNDAAAPNLAPVLYSPTQKTFSVLSPAGTPRMYHSSAALLSDATVLVGGSNPHEHYTFSSGVAFPTELSVDIFSPPYLDPPMYLLRPFNISLSSDSLTYKQSVGVSFGVSRFAGNGTVQAALLAPVFTTHSFAMNQRLLFLDVCNFGVSRVPADEWFPRWRKSFFWFSVRAPDNSSLAPPGYYMLFVVHGGVPSRGKWVVIG